MEEIKPDHRGVQEKELQEFPGCAGCVRLFKNNAQKVFFWFGCFSSAETAASSFGAFIGKMKKHFTCQLDSKLTSNSKYGLTRPDLNPAEHLCGHPRRGPRHLTDAERFCAVIQSKLVLLKVHFGILIEDLRQDFQEEMFKSL